MRRLLFTWNQGDINIRLTTYLKQAIFYQLPKEKLIYGPNQIEAMIDQNPNISQHLTLWDQKGSHVIRSKLIVTPIENAFLYVVPVYCKPRARISRS